MQLIVPQNVLHSVRRGCAMARKTLTLDERDEEELRRYLSASTLERRVLDVLADLKPAASESAVLRALLRLGMNAVQAERLRAGYQELAESRDADEPAAWRDHRDRTLARRNDLGG